jgi:hypothetical protein
LTCRLSDVSKKSFQNRFPERPEPFPMSRVIANRVTIIDFRKYATLFGRSSPGRANMAVLSEEKNLGAWWLECRLLMMSPALDLRIGENGGGEGGHCQL